MYVDESGDPGNVPGSSNHYILSGIIIKYSDWTHLLSRLKSMRQYFKSKYDLSPRIEIHSREFVRINKIKELRNITKSNRMAIIREYLKFIPVIFKDGKIINICLNKQELNAVDDFQQLAWTRLITRYDWFLKRSVRDEGMIISDDSSEVKIRNTLRKMRVYNPTPSKYTNGSYNARITKIIEDVSHRKSNLSFFIQTADVIAFALYSNEFPKGALRKFSMDQAFYYLERILLREASSKDPYGIVRQ